MRITAALMMATALACSACSEPPPPPDNLADNGLVPNDPEFNQMMSQAANESVDIGAVNLDGTTPPADSGGN